MSLISLISMDRRSKTWVCLLYFHLNKYSQLIFILPFWLFDRWNSLRNISNILPEIWVRAKRIFPDLVCTISHVQHLENEHIQHLHRTPPVYEQNVRYPRKSITKYIEWMSLRLMKQLNWLLSLCENVITTAGINWSSSE